MKKLKIFLLLGILLCFGFMLNSEVHAQDDGPKTLEINDVLPDPTTLPTSTGFGCAFNHDGTRLAVAHNGSPYITTYGVSPLSYAPKPFEVGEVLPATTQLKVSWTSSVITYANSLHLETLYVMTSNYDKFCFELYDIPAPEGGTDKGFYCHVNGVLKPIFTYSSFPNFISPYSDFGGDHPYIIVDTTSLSEIDRTITRVDNIPLVWEDLNAPTVPSGPKPFEVGDELPAGNIKISWDFTGYPIADSADFVILGDNDLHIVISEWDEDKIEMEINFDERFNLVTPGYTIITLTSPETITDLYNGNIYSSDDYYDYVHGAIFWEVVSPEYIGDYDDLYDGELLDIEEDYILPQSKVGIKLLYNNTGGTKSGTITYTFGTYGQIILTAQEDNSSTQVTSAEITYNFTNPNWNIYMIDDSLANQSFGSTRGILFAGVLLDFTYASEEERTITDITVEGDLDIDVIFTRILTEEEIIYQEGYSAGYETAREIFGWKDGDDWYNGIDAWNLGEKYARELYGFYDSTTDEWLSVSDYVARYGTGNGGGNGNGSPGASDFYNNFDKYFIPAMIIVFGGAIVLTILKVFKGRE